jgi:hypothetical protein
MFLHEKLLTFSLSWNVPLALIDREGASMSETPEYPDDDWFLYEKLLTFAQLARRIGVNPSTVWRWHDKGCYSRKGKKVRLQGCRRGGRNVTSLARYRDFVCRQNDDGAPPAGAAVPGMPEAPKSIRGGQLEQETQTNEAIQVLKMRGLID